MVVWKCWYLVELVMCRVVGWEMMELIWKCCLMCLCNVFWLWVWVFIGSSLVFV